MKTWSLVARHRSGRWQDDIEEFHPRKADAVRQAKRILRERGDEFEVIYIIADNGSELLDETEMYFKR